MKISSLINSLKGTPLRKMPVKLKRHLSHKNEINKKRSQHNKEIELIENRYGVDFGGYIPDVNSSLEESGQCNGYEASYSMPNIFKILRINEDAKILDVGCGKGYAMYLFSQFPFSKIDGVEINKSLAAIAEENMNKIFPDNNGKFNVFCENALTFSHLEDYDYIYMYNPFPRDVVEQFVKKLEEAAIKKQGKLIVIYQNPQKGSLFEEGGVFKTTLRIDGTAVFESVK